MAILPSGGLRTSYPIVLSSALVLSLSACGGGSSGGSSGTTTVQTPTTITGVVSDPAIANAKVRIDSADGKALAPVVVTDSQGKFTLTVSVGTNPSGATISATSGTDAETGYDFKGLTLKAPYESTLAVVSPLTTMVVDEMKDGADLATAKKNVAERFGVDEDKVMVDPTTDAAAQKASLQLTKLAAALRAAQGFDKVADLTQTHKKDWAAINTAVQADKAISSSAKSDVQTLASELEVIEAVKDVANAQAMLEEINRLSLLVSMRAYLKSALQYEPEADSTGDKNVIKLVEAIWTANDKKGIPSGSPKVVNLARYALNKYEINTANLDNADWAFPVALANDTQIKSIASLSVIDHTIALNDSELLGDDSTKRREYFHQSDLSPIYRSQKLVEGVVDDNFVDPLNLEVAVALAKLGFKEDADIYLKTQIFQPYYKAESYRKVAYAYIKSKQDKAVIEPYLDTALVHLNEHYKQLDNLDNETAILFRSISEDYSDINLINKSTNALSPITQYIEKQKGKPYENAYGQLVSAFSKNATAKIEAAEAANLSTETVSTALKAVDGYAAMVDGYGYQDSKGKCVNDTEHFKAKVYYYSLVADQYRRLKQAAKVQEFIDKFVNLRATYQCTSDNTEIYVRYLAEEYIFLDKVDAYKAMAQSTITKNTQYLTQANQAVITYDAVKLAESNKIEEAVQLIETTYAGTTKSKLKARLEAYTRKATNSGTPYTGVLLANRGQTAAAERMFEEAFKITLSDAYRDAYKTDKNGSLINYGCGNVSELFQIHISNEKANQKFKECIGVADGLVAHGTSQSIQASYRILSEYLLKAGMGAEGVAAYNNSLTHAANITPIKNYLPELNKTLSFTLKADLLKQSISFSEIMSTLANVQTNYISDKNTADISTYKDIVSNAVNLANSYTHVARGLRKAAIGVDTLPANLAENVLESRQKAIDVIATVTDGEPSIIAQIAVPKDKSAAYTNVILALKTARAYEKAQTVLKQSGLTESDYNEDLTGIAKSMLAQDDFPDSSVARFDLDNDGKADFYEIGATQEAINDSKIQLDDDIDADGELDTVDKTPFCKACAG